MKNPIKYRMQIPFFYNKTNTEFQKDRYERFDSMVFRQTALHLADEFWGKYPFQPSLDFATKHLQISENSNVLELGCSVGRWIGTLAKENPKAKFWGLDYSYQMLKRANEFWKEHASIYLDLSHLGFSPKEIQGHTLENIFFGLAKAEDLPFDEATQDIVLSSFLLDRLDDPMDGLKEMFRVLKSGGIMALVSPLNFYKRREWEKMHPPIKIFHLIKNMGFEVLDWQDEMILEEPLDARGNMVKWNCVAMVCQKK